MTVVLARGLDRPANMGPRSSGDSIPDDGSTHPVLARHGDLRLPISDACANGDDGIITEGRSGVEFPTSVPMVASAAILSVFGVRLVGPRVQVTGPDAPRDITGVATDVRDLTSGEVQRCSVRRNGGPALSEGAVSPLEPSVSVRCTRTRPDPTRRLVVDNIDLGPESLLGGVKVGELPKGRFINHPLDRTSFGIDPHGNQSEV